MEPHHLNRRMLLLGGVALAGLAACSGEAAKPAVAESDATLVPTTLGKLRGVKTEDGVIEFLGVRYAQPPVGALRFQAPKKPEPWNGEQAATSYGQAAVQMRSGAGAAAYPPLVQAAMTEAYKPPEGVKPEGDEDCLVLNVYAQKTGVDAGATRPVMVWLHGGGFSYGQAPLNIYQGHNLAKNHDVVFVGVNHRLNVFGFLALDSAGVPGFTGSANAGVMDIVMALEWVRDNIAQFGGDPSNVTFANYSGVLKDKVAGKPFSDFFWNTVQIAIPGAVIPIAVAAFAAYALSWMKFKGRDLLAVFIVALMVVPLQMCLIPLLRYLFAADWFPEQLSGVPSIWIAHSIFAMPLAIFLLKNFIGALPSEVIEAARVDGASHMSIFVKIVLPLSVPAIASLSDFPSWTIASMSRFSSVPALAPGVTFSTDEMLELRRMTSAMSSSRVLESGRICAEPVWKCTWRVMTIRLPWNRWILPTLPPLFTTAWMTSRKRLPTRVAVGWPSMISTARLGPERQPTRTTLLSSRMTSLMVRTLARVRARSGRSSSSSSTSFRSKPLVPWMMMWCGRR